MKNTFRQSMAWLHIWAGLTVGWILFFVFLTGTFGYATYEINRWMRPEMREIPSTESQASMVLRAQDFLRQNAQGAESWRVALPGTRENVYLTTSWQDWPAPGKTRGTFHQQHLNPNTGERLDHPVRETGGGTTLYRMHYELRYIPYQVAIRIVGVCTKFMFVAIISGIVVHRKIFADFFTFRPGKGQRSWLDGHNLLSVTSLPFHIMITWTGLVFFTVAYFPVAAEILYSGDEGRTAVFDSIYGWERVADPTGLKSVPTASIEPMIAMAQARWGEGEIFYLTVKNPDLETAEITIVRRGGSISRDQSALRFDGVTGELLDDSGTGRDWSVAGRFSQVMFGLHEGRFAAPLMRILYILAGFAGTAMIATGLLLWSTKRKAKLKSGATPHFGIQAVDILNLGTIIGLPLAIAAYFWANRLLPIDMEQRRDWEVHVMFIAWAVCFIIAIWRPMQRAWPELCWATAFAYAALPVVNALTTDRHLGVTLVDGDWIVAGFDLSAIAAGLFFAFLAISVRRKIRSEITVAPIRHKKAGAQSVASSLPAK